MKSNSTFVYLMYAAAAAAVASVMSDSVRPHGLQPTRPLRPWDFPGRSTGVGAIAFFVLGLSIVSILGLW